MATSYAHMFLKKVISKNFLQQSALVACPGKRSVFCIQNNLQTIIYYYLRTIVEIISNDCSTSVFEVTLVYNTQIYRYTDSDNQHSQARACRPSNDSVPHGVYGSTSGGWEGQWRILVQHCATLVTWWRDRPAQYRSVQQRGTKISLSVHTSNTTGQIQKAQGWLAVGVTSYSPPMW